MNTFQQNCFGLNLEPTSEPLSKLSKRNEHGETRVTEKSWAMIAQGARRAHSRFGRRSSFPSASRRIRHAHVSISNRNVKVWSLVLEK